MMMRGAKRSARAAQASRRNGARSRGPRTATGRERSAQNSLKHGLFSQQKRIDGPLPAMAQSLGDCFAAAGIISCSDVDMVISAEVDLTKASLLIELADAELDAMLADMAFDTESFTSPLRQRGRIAGYERRFRGRRDRALRRLLADHPELGCD